MKSKKVFLVLERKALKMLSYVNDELYKELYPRYLIINHKVIFDYLFKSSYMPV